mgnify:CR=1 FL=1
MAIRKVVQEGDEILRKICKPVERFDERLGALLDDMKDTVRHEHGAFKRGQKAFGVDAVVVVIGAGILHGEPCRKGGIARG